MNTSSLNTLRTLLALCVATAVSPVIGQTLPPPYPETFPLGTLTISCTIYTNSSAKSSYTTKDLLNDLGRDLGVTFPAGSYLQVMTTPYQGYYDSFGGIFPVASSGLTVVARSKNGQSWDVSSYIQLGMDTTYSSGFPIGPGYLMSGSVGPSPESPTDVTVMFMGSFQYSDAGHQNSVTTINLKGPCTLSSKSGAKPAASTNLAVNASILMSSGSGNGTFRGQDVIVTGKVLMIGKSVWNVTF